nr:hypothetical protein CFP56_66081 [Quercus suber]
MAFFVCLLGLNLNFPKGLPVAGEWVTIFCLLFLKFCLGSQICGDNCIMAIEAKSWRKAADYQSNILTVTFSLIWWLCIPLIATFLQ